MEHLCHGDARQTGLRSERVVEPMTEEQVVESARRGDVESFANSGMMTHRHTDANGPWVFHLVPGDHTLFTSGWANWTTPSTWHRVRTSNESGFRSWCHRTGSSMRSTCQRGVPSTSQPGNRFPPMPKAASWRRDRPAVPWDWRETWQVHGDAFSGRHQPTALRPSHSPPQESPREATTE